MIGKKQTVKGSLRNSRGFTLMELIAVLIIIGIVSAIAITRSTITDDVQLQSEVDTLKGHLRFAQYKALNDLPGTRWGINVAGSSYDLVKYDPGSNTTNVWLPGDSSVTHTFAGGVTAAVTGSNPVLFDEWGSPGASATSVTMGSKTITITPNTGFIP
jgi:prepilin-type N-terminal cleavage/methylation domain-containing protein